MFRLSSNIGKVIERTQRLRDQDIPAALVSAMSPARWRELAKDEAKATLEALATEPEKKFITGFIRTIYATIFEGGLLMGMENPAAHFSLAGAQLSIPGTETGKYSEVKVDDPIEFENQVLDWVANEKRWVVERDGPKTLDNVFEKAAWITRLLLSPPGLLTNVPNGPNRMSEQEARDSLIEPVLEYILKTTTKGEPNLDPTTADMWLRAVMAAWRELVRNNYPSLVKSDIRAARRQAA